jgi:hypothetical protein
MCQTINQLRNEFKILQRNATYHVSLDVWREAVNKLLPENPSPADWVEAAKKATTKCGRCNGTGQYQWGACVNGKMTHSATCFRCEGKGYQDQEDYARNYGYDNYAIAKAFAGMCAE